LVPWRARFHTERRLLATRVIVDARVVGARGVGTASGDAAGDKVPTAAQTRVSIREVSAAGASEGAVAEGMKGE
jgi:hypothetical protein